MNSLEEFTCELYNSNGNFTDINSLRYKLFCIKKGGIESSQLPPCHDCLQKHILRSNYQAAIWRRCLKNNANIPTPVGKGWLLERNSESEPMSLAVDWMFGKPAPDAVLDLISCNCSKACDNDKCTCFSNKLKCTYMCKIAHCSNQRAEEANYDGDSDDGDLELYSDFSDSESDMDF